MISNFVAKILDEANIVDIISHYLKLHKSGANYFGLCPFHSDKHPSMSVSSKKKIFKCFSCGATGNVITFVQKYEKISYIDSIKKVAKMIGYSDEQINSSLSNTFKIYNQTNEKYFQLNSEANEIFTSLLFNENNKEYLQYLYDRKLSNETIKKFNIGFCGKDNSSQIIFDLLTNKDVNVNAKWNENDLLKYSLITFDEKTSKITDFFHNRITFPIKDKNGFIIGFIARDIKKNTKLKYLSTKETKLFNKSNVLYNFDSILVHKPKSLIILEGNIDLISLYEANIDESQYGAIALMGVALTENHINLIKSTNFIHNIILWFDNDAAGLQSTITNGKKLLFAGFNVFVINNTNYKDVNEILINDGKQKILNILDDKDKLDFISFYIKQSLQNLTSINIRDKVNELLMIVKNYGDQLFYEKYCKLIVDITKLSFDDVKLALKKIVKTNWLINKKNKNDFFLYPIEKIIIDSYKQLLFFLVSNPSYAIDAYSNIEYKKIDNNLVNDFLYFIKNIAIKTYDKSNIYDEMDKLIDSLFDKNKISKNAFIIIKQIIFNNKVDSTNFPNVNNLTKNKCISLVNHINICCNELLIIQLKHKVKKSNLNEQEKEQIFKKINLLTRKNKEYKKLKKSKFYVI